MSREISVAAIQMYSVPGKVEANLARAEALVRQAAAAGAELVVLPEFFNTGYQFSDDSYVLAEWRQGRTWLWLLRLAMELRIHLAGAFIVRRDGHQYDTLLLGAPDGQHWAYEKQQPFAWERAYFRPGYQPVIAQTSLGRIGLLAGWDVAYPAHFRAYAGQVDLLVVSICPPRFHDTTLRFPDGHVVPIGELTLISRLIRDRSAELFGPNVQRQAAALGVPVVQAGPPDTGRLRTTLPHAHTSFFLFTIFSPQEWRRLDQADLARTDIGFFADSQIVRPDGAALRPQDDADQILLTRLELPSQLPVPRPQGPPTGLPLVAYLLEFGLRKMMEPIYAAAMGRRTQYLASKLLLGAALLLIAYLLNRWRRREQS
ncbi:MAG: carbon-nitrogen hydrolase family protein [Anaerolineales bacterium]|nr:carbon-nitrogen hydrolase family protein [Anaerolineales bacterium]MCB8960685.1 carbon-nitrogen hydrolase family protein [Ardenticatenales bacterium]